MRRQAAILGLAACVLVVSAWVFAREAGVVLIVAGALFGWMTRHLTRPQHVPAPPPAVDDNTLSRLRQLEARTSSLRHDLRGILSPAYLTAERLLGHEDPIAKRAGEMMIKTVERASERLKETKMS